MVAMNLLQREILAVPGTMSELDFIEELRLRRWARENYVPQDERDQSWHPIVHEEMSKKDREIEEPTLVYHTTA